MTTEALKAFAERVEAANRALQTQPDHPKGTAR